MNPIETLENFNKKNLLEDVVGRFYGEFVKYGGRNGQSLGVVLTPRHIIELFCKLIDLGKLYNNRPRSWGTFYNNDTSIRIQKVHIEVHF